MEMPAVEPFALAKKDSLLARLREVLPEDAVIHAEEETRAYECDALTAYKCPPLAVVLPRSTREVADILRICHELEVPVVPRGSGTSLAGGALPTADCVILGVARLTEVLEVDYDDRIIRVQTGRTNLSVTGAVEADGFFYAPDPSSQLACAIAGNIAMNSGGAHCLKYGVTTNNLLGVTLVQMGGTVVEIGGGHHGCGRARPARPGLRVRGTARRRDRGDAAHLAQTRRRAPRADRLRRQRDGRRLRRRHHQGGRPAGGHRVHGPPRHPRDRGLRQGRLSRMWKRS